MTGPANDELAALLSRCALADQRAFGALYQASSAKLFGVAVRITKRRDWAEEVLQESFVKIWHHAGNYDAEKSAPMTWMTAIVRNRALDLLRRPREVQASDEGVPKERLTGNTSGLSEHPIPPPISP